LGLRMLEHLIYLDASNNGVPHLYLYNHQSTLNLPLSLHPYHISSATYNYHCLPQPPPPPSPLPIYPSTPDDYFTTP
jgi:hypothetical protein